MRDLEQKIVAWRKEMAHAGIERADLLDELESHLRQNIAQLSSAGIPEPEAFRIATRELGNAADLQQEFSKVAETHPPASLLTSVAVNFFAAWFAVAGLNDLIAGRGFFRHSFHDLQSFTLPPMNVSLFFHVYNAVAGIFLLLLAVGLYRRRKFWRMASIVWAAWMSVFTVGYATLNPVKYLSLYHYAPIEHARYEIAGLSLPYWAFHTYCIMGLPVLLLVILVITRSSVRELFGSSPKTSLTR